MNRIVPQTHVGHSMIIAQRNALGREPFIGQEWNELPETIIEAANTEAFKLALRAQASPH